MPHSAQCRRLTSLCIYGAAVCSHHAGGITTVDDRQSEGVQLVIDHGGLCVSESVGWQRAGTFCFSVEGDRHR